MFKIRFYAIQISSSLYVLLAEAAWSMFKGLQGMSLVGNAAVAAASAATAAVVAVVSCYCSIKILKWS